MEKAFGTKRLWLVIAIIVIAALCVMCFVACDGGNSVDNESGSNSEPHTTHSYINYVYNNDATCVDDGTETAKCEYCNETETRTKAKTATGEHSFVDYKYNNDATCIDDGTESAKCENCKETDTRKSDSYLATGVHNYVNYVCSACGVYLPDAPITKGLKYSAIKENGEVIGYSVDGIDTATSTAIMIPPLYNDKPVLSIGDNAFRDCIGLTSLTIPNSVTSIGYDAIYSYKNIINIHYAGSIAEWCGISFGGYNGNPFCHAHNLYINNKLVTELVIPYAVTSINSYAFYRCSSLTSIKISNSVTSIGSNAFMYCGSLTSIEIPNSVTSIGSDAFMYCGGLTSINVYSDNPNFSSLDGALYDKNMTTVIFVPYVKSGTITLPNSVTSIGERAFYGCSNLTSIGIPNSVTSIGDGAFYGCSGLKSIEIPSGVTSIGMAVFYGCSSLTSIEIPNSVTSIGRDAFSGCSRLTSIEIPNSVTSIGSQIFSFCSSLTSITIPNSVTSIGNSAFYGCSSLTSITIPNSVKSIESQVFYGCSSLTSIEIPNSVTSIGRDAFMYCGGLTSIKYNGTMAQWEEISKADNLSASSSIKTVLCNDGTITLHDN
ncbi:MAG: leucine-rich repeat domain-containing protein [Clostridiales bacterium]|nr:leucine-rich repeat domain-containing protein [Clostridiales bacterium]